ncbi:MAG: PEGA domain-containing protein [Calditrichaeota bacterium]|nr:PEGA domain-containing protein [Calditrichota bacterium]
MPFRAFIVASIVILLSTPIHAQILQEMEVSIIPEAEQGAYINQDPSRAILVVHSNIPDLDFETNNKGVVDVTEPRAGEYWVYLHPGTHQITVKKEGFMAVKQRIFIPAKGVREFRVTAIQMLGAYSGFDENRAEIRLNYQPSSSDEVVYGGLDDMIMKIDFSKGYAVFNPSAGLHKIKLNAGGNIWEKSYDLKSKEKIEEQISFASGKQEQLDIKDPGNLFITSEPSGATVYLNKVEQGVTPLTKDDVQPGTYQVEVVRELYLPESIVIKVESNSYAKENFQLTPNFGRLSISSNPSGAMLWINDKNVGRTPYDVGQYNAGAYSLRIIHEMYYEETDTFNIEPGSDFIQTYSLRPQFGGIRINSNPSGALLNIDGQVSGTTPVTKDQLASGTHIIRLTKENYFEFETTVEISDGQNFNETYQLKANFGLLTVVSNPPGAEVVIAGENHKLGKTPLRDVKLSAGTYTIKVEKDLYESYEMPVSLMIGGERKLEPILKRKTGKLRIKSEPPMADIYLNGEPKGKTPTIINELPTGDYEIRLQKSGYDIQLGKVRIEHNQQAEYSMTLGTKGTVEWKKRRTQARMLSFIPSAGQFSSKQYVKGSIYAGAFLGSVAMVFLASLDYSNAENDYNAAMSDYASADDQAIIDQHRLKVESSFDEMQSASDKAKMFTIVAGGVYAWQFIDAWIWGGGKRPVSGRYGSLMQIEPYALANEKSTTVGLKITLGGKL